ncbi:MAG TPA: thiamine-phosphate kinase [Bacteroidales bacterium]|nr:thiamine-phosphate kinase [Bacteroidales bacterium]
MAYQKPTPLSEIGEFGLIDRLTNGIKPVNETTVMGIGDDAAVIDAGEKCTVVTTDMLTEGIHFDLVYTPLKHLGYKAIIVNLSDVYAMNATPTQVTVSLAVSSKFSVEALEELYSGIRMACDKYGVDLVGGDTVSSLSGLIISVTAIGTAKKEDIRYRSGAKVNDLICVSGDLGAAYIGLQLLEREKALFQQDQAVQPDLSGNDYILERQLKPEARKDIIEQLQKEGIQTHAMIDISDGLSSELLHICKSSDTGCRIYHDKVPIDASTAMMAEEFKIEPLICALHGGEDYELLFTVPLSEYEKVSELENVKIIGNITDKSEDTLMVTGEGQAMPLTAQGWDGVKR